MPAPDYTLPAFGTPPVSAQERTNFLALQASIWGNLLADPTFLIWPAGDTSDPAHWQTAGAGRAITRAGTGLGDTNRKVGKFCIKLTSGGGAVSNVFQNVFSTTSFDDYFKGVICNAAFYVKTSNASPAVRVFIDDGNSKTYGTAHTGDGTWQLIFHTKTLDAAAATKIVAGVEGAISAVYYVSGGMFLFADSPPSRFIPPPVLKGTIRLSKGGTLSTGTDVDRFEPDRPFIITEVQLRAKTAPATQAIIVDVNHWDGSAWTTAFTTKPQIAAAANYGAQTPDGTYRYRCFKGIHGATPTDAVLDFDIDQVGTGTAGADLSVSIRTLQFARPHEIMLGASEES